MCWPRSISGRLASPHASAGSKKTMSLRGCGGRSPTRRRSPSSRASAGRAEKPVPSRSSTAWPAPGPTGAGRAAISIRKPMPVLITTRLATCWRPRSRRPILPSGSTPGCTGPTASMGRPRAITTSISAPANWSPRKAPTNTRSHTPASSRASMTIWSMKAASWTCGPARRGCSSTGPAPAPISRACAARTNRCRAAASPRA